MGLPSVFKIGTSGMTASKAAVTTTGHNIANANTEGYSRQRVQTRSVGPTTGMGGTRAYMGKGTEIQRIERVNDEYVEKQIRHAQKDLSHLEEKDSVLRQLEDIFNEMNGDGLNRIIAKFFNEFRKLSNDPDNEAVRQSLRESSQAIVNDIRRLRLETVSVSRHIDSKMEGLVREINGLAEELKGLNLKIQIAELAGSPANDLQDKRDILLKKLAAFMELHMRKDKQGNYVVEIKGVGPLVVGPEVQVFSLVRSPADSSGKPENAYDLLTSASIPAAVTHRIKEGKIGALLETRDKTISTIMDRLDDLAFTLVQAVNSIHRQGFTRDGTQNINFFKPLFQRERAAEFIDLSDEIKANANHIAAAAVPDAPGDNRIALAIAGLQSQRIMNEGRVSLDEWYNAIVGDVGVLAQKSREGMNQQKDIMTHLNKVREQISGVSIDEETANLMQFQHIYDASAKVVAVADEMLKTVLDMKR